MATRAERIQELQTQIENLRARPAEPPFDGSGFPPVVRFKYELIVDGATLAYTGVAMRVGDLWIAATF